MSIGNLKTDGGKGTNWPWQYRMLKGLQGIIDVINSTANGSEYEAKLVNIDCPPPTPPATTPSAGVTLYLEVRTWDTVSGGFTNISYYLPGSDTEYPASEFAACTITYLEAGDATEVTLKAVLDELKADLADKVVIPVLLRKAGNVVPGTPDTITDAVKAISFANYSSVNAEISVIDNYPNTPATYSLITLKPGEVINLDAGGNANAFPANTFKYEPDTAAPNTNGDLLITYTK
jgi:hypothetical protein